MTQNQRFIIVSACTGKGTIVSGQYFTNVNRPAPHDRWNGAEMKQRRRRWRAATPRHARRCRRWEILLLTEAQHLDGQQVEGIEGTPHFVCGFLRVGSLTGESTGSLLPFRVRHRVSREAGRETARISNRSTGNRARCLDV